MALYQSSVLKKHLAAQDEDKIRAAYQAFTTYFHNPKVQANIRASKEEQFQEGFLRELFVNILGYTINPEPDFNLTTELKNVGNAKKTDGAILRDGKAIAVIELKGTDTRNLDKINEQAFAYKNNQPDCTYVVTSNFEKLRFFIHHAVEHVQFNLFHLDYERFAMLWLFLQKDNLLNDIPLKVKEESLLKEEQVTKNLYKDYSGFKEALWEDMVRHNPKADELELYKKSQKLLDRFLFILFAEDKGLLPPNSISVIVEDWKKLKDLDEYKPLYERFLKFFGYMNTGFEGKKYHIPAYNGGLFKPDELLDKVIIGDDVLHRHTLKLSEYDFETEVDVNILGHIFEHSLNDIENVRARLAGEEVDKKKTKRKKDGVFYTPKYITKYIVDHTVGRLCEEKKAEIGIDEEEFAKSRKGRRKATLEKLAQQLRDYRTWLLDLTICDPACGSGAFLNQALNFLIAEHRYIDELEAQLYDTPMIFPDVESTILEQNIYGVDINEESVEIARLSLWLRTAKKGRKLNSLSDNIKVGNSLIDDPEVAGDLAFSWEKEFPKVFVEKEKRAFHITTATHDSRTSQRMIDHKVRLKRDGGTRPKAQPVWLEPEDEISIANTVAGIVKEDELNILAFNICGDHMHLLLVCEENEVSNIVRKIKGRTSRELHSNKGINPLVRKKSEKSIPLWTQKFGCNEVKSDEQLRNTLNYIQTNRYKHELPPLPELEKIIETICVDTDQAFRKEYKGGFDVVIGNPPYVFTRGNQHLKMFNEFIWREFEYNHGKINLYSVFLELSLSILIKERGRLGFITPETFIRTSTYSEIRRYLINNLQIESISVYGIGVFENVTAETITMIVRKDFVPNNVVEFYKHQSIEDYLLFTEKQNAFNATPENRFIYGSSAIDRDLFNKIKKGKESLGSFIDVRNGIATKSGKKSFLSNTKLSETYKKLLEAPDLFRYGFEWPEVYINYNKELLHRPRKEDTFLSCKILIQRVSSRLICTIDSEQYYTFNSVNNLIEKSNVEFNLHFLLGILNSRLMDYFYRKNYSLDASYTITVTKSNLDSLPIPVWNSSDHTHIGLSDLVKRITFLTQSRTKLISTLSQLLRSKVGIDKLSKNLQNWPSLDFKGFLGELKKKKVKLTLEEEAEWMEYFNKKKAEANALQTEIDTLDRQIDEMVYDLYELTEEERRIVEGGVNN